jgi:phospholipid transport system substrate-binding protein
MRTYFQAPLIALSIVSSSAALAQGNESQRPDVVVRSAIDGVMSAIHAEPAAGQGDPDAVNRIVEQRFLPHTDFLRTTRYAVGNAWAQATPAQQQALFTQFQTLLAHTYAAQLVQIREQNVQFRYLPMAPVAPNATDAVVKTVVTTSGDTMNIDYRVAKTGSGWKIYDINMMGAWMIQVYRQQFADQIARNGIDGLVKFLAAHNER